jgi:predicted transcriptional regulator
LPAEFTGCQPLDLVALQAAANSAGPSNGSLPNRVKSKEELEAEEMDALAERLKELQKATDQALERSIQVSNDLSQSITGVYESDEVKNEAYVDVLTRRLKDLQAATDIVEAADEAVQVHGSPGAPQSTASMAKA